ncbi:MAG: ABC transporter ATP-binding protein [Acholeplasmataceae bacterium]|jgi:ABC-type lipoprotein export system ATPase subunit|nr:ABC transporter ATP-binding protein [Acholeplasmataceae bacterium]
MGIFLKNVSKQYDELFALRNINLLIHNGTFLAVVGKSGSGKSTLLNLIGDLDNPSDGSVSIDGINLTTLQQIDHDRFRNQYIGFIFQFSNLEPSYTVYENVELPLIIAGVKKTERKQKVIEALTKANIIHKKNQRAITLSGGEKQRVAIARAIVNQPKIILADEPCGNLDTENSDIIMSLLKSLQNEENIIVLVTHDVEHSKLANRVVTLSDGEVVKDTGEN